MINYKFFIIGLILFLLYNSTTKEHYLAYVPWNLATRYPRSYWDIRGNPFYYGWYGRGWANPIDLFPWYPGTWSSILYPYSYNADGTASVLTYIEPKEK